MAMGSPPGATRRGSWALPILVALVATLVVGCVASTSLSGALTGAVSDAVSGARTLAGDPERPAAAPQVVLRDRSDAPDAPPPMPVPPGTWWHPRPGASWQLQLSGTPDLSSDADVFVLDVDAATQETVAAIHHRGARAVCRISTGVWDAALPTASRYPQDVLGRSVDGYDNHRYLNVHRLDALRGPVDARLDLCRSKGFDGVDPRGDDTVVDVGADGIGFAVTYADQLAFDRMVAMDAHAAGLAIGLHSSVPAIDRFITDLLPLSDFAVVERCAATQSCTPFAGFTRSGRPAFQVEYLSDYPGASTTSWQGALGSFCPAARALGISAILKSSPGTEPAWRRTCP